MLICVFFLYKEPVTLAGVCSYPDIADTRMRIRSINPLTFAALGLVSQSWGILGILRPLGVWGSFSILGIGVQNTNTSSHSFQETSGLIL